MAFQYNAFGQKVSSDPGAAHAALVRLFKRHSCSTSEIALELGVSKVTLGRWIKKLTASGWPDPGDDYRRVRGTDKTKRAMRTRVLIK